MRKMVEQVRAFVKANQGMGLLALVMAFFASNASAFTYTYDAAGATAGGGTNMFWDIADLTHNAVNGAPAFAFCVIGIVVTGYMLWNAKIIGAFGVLACIICVIKAEAILTSLGYLMS